MVSVEGTCEQAYFVRLLSWSVGFWDTAVTRLQWHPVTDNTDGW